MNADNALTVFIIRTDDRDTAQMSRFEWEKDIQTILHVTNHSERGYNTGRIYDIRLNLDMATNGILNSVSQR